MSTVLYSQDSSKNIAHIYEKCGIITTCLTDPLSQLINKIMGLHEDDPNAIGFYYEAELHGVNRCTVILFNIYDNDPIPWLRLGYTMDLLLASPFVTKITYYPIATTPSDSSSSLLSRATMSKGINGNKMSKKLEDMFRAVVVDTISTNAKAIHDKNISYTALLLKIAGITGEDADRLTSKIITGYSLVNRVLLTLMGIKSVDFTKISSSIIPTPLLKKPISIISPRENGNENDIKYIIEESRREITKLVAIFVDLFTTHDIFRANILATRSSITLTNKSSSPTNLDRLFVRENELVSHIVGGLQNGIISNTTLNDIIKDLSNERFSLGNYQSLPTSINPSKTIQVTSDNIMCTFQQPQSQTNIDPLRDLGIYITHLIDSFDNPEPLTINLGEILNIYNNAIKGTNLPKIPIPHIDTHTLSRQSIVIIPGDIDREGLLNNENRIIPSVAIPMYNGNLTSLSESQLLDILVYIDSLRDSDGTSDTRFANLQNEITHEIARRRKTQNISQ
jgi:hypothetical protein